MSNPSPALTRASKREREGPIAKQWEGEDSVGNGAWKALTRLAALATLSRFKAREREASQSLQTEPVQSRR